MLAATLVQAEEEPVIITATRISEDVAKVPASITVIGGEELRERGAKDLAAALSLAAGVDIAPGADAGPASSVPEFWGLKESDAFLLVVDGVPWGGAFNPALASLDLHDVERIEVMRGAAPVMYGATSFVGVIHVIHKHPALVDRTVRSFAGNHGSKGLGLSLPLSKFGGWTHALNLDFEKQGFRDPRTSFERDHASWRAETPAGGGALRLAADGTFLRQKPASPLLREGRTLSPRIPYDANQNPDGAFIDEDRVSLSALLERKAGPVDWSAALAYSHSEQRVFRGFLNDVTVPLDAHGFRETIGVTDFYFDGHLRWEPGEGVKLIGGVDHLHGRGGANGGDFDYAVNLDGSGAPSGGLLTSAADVRVTDQRDLSGLYGFIEWEPVPQVLLEGGARLNRTEETRATSDLDLTALTLAGGADRLRLWHGSGSAAATWTPWRDGRDLAALFFSYRNNFKPAAVDFGLDTDFRIIAPETAQSYELGTKSRLRGDKVDFNASFFLMDLRNVLVPTTIGGNPAFVNAGATRHQGLELEGSAELAKSLRARAGYSLRDARFVDFIQDFGGVPTQLAGKRLEMSARNIFGGGLTYAPASGFNATTQLQWVGGRFLNRRNTAPAPAYAAWSAGLGYRVAGWEFRVDGRNLSNERPPVSESELGDSQYYLLPARRVDISASWTF